jgi:hypothetical protein
MGPSFLKTQELMSFVIAAAIGFAWTLGGTFGLLGVAPYGGNVKETVSGTISRRVAGC